MITTWDIFITNVNKVQVIPQNKTKARVIKEGRFRNVVFSSVPEEDDDRVCTTCGIKKPIVCYAWRDSTHMKRRLQCQDCRINKELKSNNGIPRKRNRVRK